MSLNTATYVDGSSALKLREDVSSKTIRAYAILHIEEFGRNVWQTARRDGHIPMPGGHAMLFDFVDIVLQWLIFYADITGNERP